MFALADLHLLLADLHLHLRGLVDHPEDDARPLVLADWLEEEGFPLLANAVWQLSTSPAPRRLIQILALFPYAYAGTPGTALPCPLAGPPLAPE